MFDINKVLDVLLIRIPVIKTYLDNISIEEDSSIKIAATNGCRLIYNEDYLSTLTLEEQVFVLAHEFFHIILKHRLRSEDKNQEIWNYATDAVINQMLKKMGLKLIDNIIDCPDAFGKSSEEYYEYLKNRKDIDELLNQYRNNREKTFIPHENWVKENQKEDTESMNNTNSLPDITESEIIEKNQEMIEQENNDYIEKMNEQQEKEEKIIKDIGESKPIINWIDYLNYKKRKSKTSNYDFFNGEFDEEGIYFYPFKQTEESKVEILIDTSGSVDEELVKSFLKECKNIYNNSIMSIGCFDTKFYGFKKIKRKEELDNFTIEGRGGTDFDVAINSFTHENNTKIIFTDGCAKMPDRPFNCIWIVYSDIEIKPKGGTIIYVDPDTLKINKNKRL